MVTSFLGVSLSVVDFLADGFRLEKQGIEKFYLTLLTFLPPLVIAVLYPNAFQVGLSYAGIFLTILIVLLPVLLVRNGRLSNISYALALVHHQGIQLPAVVIHQIIKCRPSFDGKRIKKFIGRNSLVGFLPEYYINVCDIRRVWFGG
jgi:tyrosine-specific transport protein